MIFSNTIREMLLAISELALALIGERGREVRECPMIETNGRYELNLDGWQDLLTGNESGGIETVRLEAILEVGL